MKFVGNLRVATSLLIVFCALPALADQITVMNASFETPVTMSTASPDYWTAFGNFSGGSYNPYEFGGGDAFYTGANPSTDPANGGSGYSGIVGENLGYSYHPSSVSGFYQGLSATLQANTTYSLNISTFARSGYYQEPFAGSTLELLAGNTVIASTTDSTGPSPGSFEIQNALVDALNIDPSLIGQGLTILFETTQVGNVSTDWDNVRLTATSDSPATTGPATPEPGTVFLLVPATLLVLRKFKTRTAGPA